MIMHLKQSGFILLASLLLVIGSCMPAKDIVFLGIKNIQVEPGEKGDPVMKAEALFNNPNKTKMKLREIHVDVMVNGKLSAQVNEQFTLTIPAHADFSVSFSAQLSLKELGLMDTIINLLGGKKYEIEYLGYVRVALHGITVKVPVKYKEELRLRL